MKIHFLNFCLNKNTDCRFDGLFLCFFFFGLAKLLRILMANPKCLKTTTHIHVHYNILEKRNMPKAIIQIGTSLSQSLGTSFT